MIYLNSHKKRSGWLLLGLMISLGCLDQIDLEPPASVQQGIVINAKLTHGSPSYIEVDLNRVFDFTGQSLQRVGARSVILHNDLGQEISVPEVGAGRHELYVPETFEVEPGISFHLQISTFDGRELVSAPDRLYDVPEPIQLQGRNILRDGVNTLGEDVQVPFYEFLIETPIASDGSGDKARLKWDFERTYKVTDEPEFPAEVGNVCYVTELASPTRVAVEDGNKFGGASITTSVYEEQIGSILAEGYVLTVKQQSLSPGAYEYWDAVAQSIERTGNLFEAPAGKIRTNFEITNGSNESSEIFGYFYVTKEKIIRHYVSPDEVGNPTTWCPPPPVPPPPGSDCAVFICCDCLLVDGSSREQPNYWEEVQR